MIEEAVNKLRLEAEKFIPSLLGILLIDEYGFPIANSLSTSFEDPIVVSGLISTATAMMENSLKELSNSDFELLYAQGNKISIFVGKVGKFYLSFITNPSVKVGTIFMEYKVLKPKLEEILRQFQEV